MRVVRLEKCFGIDGQITQDLGSDGNELADELRGNIAFYEHEINRVDACYSGSAPAEECEGMSEWPPISEWQTEKEGALLQVAEWRRILDELGGGYSLSNLLPDCGSAHAFLQSKSKWYYHGASC